MVKERALKIQNKVKIGEKITLSVLREQLKEGTDGQDLPLDGCCRSMNLDTPGRAADVWGSRLPNRMSTGKHSLDMGKRGLLFFFLM